MLSVPRTRTLPVRQPRRRRTRNDGGTEGNTVSPGSCALLLGSTLAKSSFSHTRATSASLSSPVSVSPAAAAALAGVVVVVGAPGAARAAEAGPPTLAGGV